MGYQLYEILTMFAVYSLLGYFMAYLYRRIRGEKRTGAAVKGPYSVGYGIGALAVILFAGHVNGNFFYVFAAGMVCGTVLEILSEGIRGLIARERKTAYRFYHTLFWGILAVLLVFHWNPLLIAITRYISPWINMAILLVLYMELVKDIVNGIWSLFYRQEHDAGER